MYGELASVREVVDLSTQDALDRAQTFVTRLGYETVQRTPSSIIVTRRIRKGMFGHSLRNLTVIVEPQSRGGVRIKVRGNDRDGVFESQAEWTRWAESLPKKGPEGRVDESVAQGTNTQEDVTVRNKVPSRSEELRNQIPEIQAKLEKEEYGGQRKEAEAIQDTDEEELTESQRELLAELSTLTKLSAQLREEVSLMASGEAKYTVGQRRALSEQLDHGLKVIDELKETVDGFISKQDGERKLASHYTEVALSSVLTRASRLRQELGNVLEERKRQRQQPRTQIQENEYGQALQRDTTARLIVPEDDPLPKLRFECSEFEKSLNASANYLWLLTEIQHYEPIQIATHASMEWWWFRGDFYKVEYEEGRPSADLGADLAVDEFYSSKWSLDGSEKEGYAPDEVAEGVFEMRGKKEDGFERADRLDKAAAIRNQLGTIEADERYLNEQDCSRDYGIEKDVSARIVTRKSWFSTRVLFESSKHQSPELLTTDVGQYEGASELQKYHPLFISKQIGRGRLWRSQVVLEWWWFKDYFYVAKREKGHQSEVLARLAEEQSKLHVIGKSNAPLPLMTIGLTPDHIAETIFEEGYAPEEIARLVFAHQGQPETLEAKFHRIQAAKALLTQFGHELWSSEQDALVRRRYEEYLETKKTGYRGGYKQWDREQTKQRRERLYGSVANIEVSRTRLQQEQRTRTLGEITQRNEDLNRINYMEGWEFEQYVADALRRSGYTVESTQLSGDQGVDLLLDMDGRRVAVQLKRHTRPLGNKAVQEVFAGMIHYAAQEAWVITTSSFTKGALELARSTGVRLIDGNELREWLADLQNENESPT